MIKAVYDANVLFSAPLRDLLLNLATVRIVQPYWSHEILREWSESLLRQRPDLKRKSIMTTRDRMNSRFPQSLIEGYENIADTLQLPDQNDRHVLAVAILAQVPNIVTLNLKHFPSNILKPLNKESLSPDEFVFRISRDKPYGVIMAAKRHRVGLKNPPKTVDEYLATLEKQRLTKTVAFLREHRSEI